jgi:hypothetical protein
MKSTLITLVGIAVFLPMIGIPQQANAARHPNTAEWYLANASDYEGKEITLDVAMVKPAHWKSPDPGIAFFHALTFDKKEDQRGGAILMMVPDSLRGKIVKKYEMNVDRGNLDNTDRLKGVLRVIPRKRPGKGLYVLDYEGLAWPLIKDKVEKMELEENAEQSDFDAGTGGHGRRQQ